MFSIRSKDKILVCDSPSDIEKSLKSGVLLHWNTVKSEILVNGLLTLSAYLNI